MHKFISKGGWSGGRFVLILSLATATFVFAETPSEETADPQTGTRQQENQQGSSGRQEIQPDNTGRNAKEQITAEDQGGSAEDREMTRNIRRELVKSDELSTMAKNIKVITVNGKVTLRGPVGSQQEKAAIARIAEKVAGTGKVADQLETIKR